MKLYKFRKLTNKKDFDHLKQILEEKLFWCSKFYELNDPMEGVYQVSGKKGVDIFKKIKENQEVKEGYKICSFSSIKGFLNPAMWGYYTNGFKGVAIEIEVGVSCGNLKKIGNVEEVKYRDKLPSSESEVKTILLYKSAAWEHEYEHRFLIESDDKKHEIGNIKSVCFGLPYGNTVNSEGIQSKIKDFEKYIAYKDRIKKIVENTKIECCDVEVENGVVIKSDKNLCSQK